MKVYIVAPYTPIDPRVVCRTSASPSFTTSGYNNNTNVPLLPISLFQGFSLDHNLQHIINKTQQFNNKAKVKKKIK